MEILLKAIMLIGLGVVAGFINVMAGGGSTLTMPILIFMGLDSAAANGTNRVAVFFQNLTAVTTFHNDELYDFPTVVRYALWSLPGAILGAFVAVRITDALFQKLLGAVIIGVIITVLLPAKRVNAGDNPRKNRLIYPVLLLIGFYAGFIQAGVGFLLMSAMIHILKMNMVQVNKHKVFIILFTSVPALAVFALSANIHYAYAASLSVGNAFGGWWAAHVSIKKGEKLIRWVLLVVAAFMALKLFGLF
jgi:uncharacterized protein